MTVIRAHSFITSTTNELSVSDSSEEEQTSIHLWFITERPSKTIVVTVQDFPVWCFIELPKFKYDYGCKLVNWSQSDVDLLVLRFKSLKFGRDDDRISDDNGIIKGVFTRKSKLYYYQPKDDAFPMIKLFFRTTDAMKKFCSNVEEKARPKEDRNGKPIGRGIFFGEEFGGKITLRAWEWDPSSITQVRKFYTEIGAQPSSWLDIDTTKASSIIPKDSKNSRFKADEYIFRRIDCFKPLPADVQVGASNPRLMAIDIETYTDNHIAMPNSGNPEHVIFMISVVYQELFNRDSRKRIIINLTEAPLNGDHELHKAHIDEVITVGDEIEMIETLGNLVERFDPEIITGYNVHTYDYSYINGRIIILDGGNKDGIWPSSFSRRKDKCVKIKSSDWHSSGYGANINIIPTIEGRLKIDMMSLIKRDYKLEKYSLDRVAKEFLGPDVGKHSVTPKDMFLAYEACNKSPLPKGAIDEMTRVAAYCIVDSELVIELFIKMNVWIGLVELSNASGVPIEDTYSRGQQCRGVSLIYDMVSRENVVMDSRAFKKESTFKKEEDENSTQSKTLTLRDGYLRYKGGSVQEPIPGIHTNILCVDFASLYPSIAAAYNISWETFDVSSTPIEEVGFSGKSAAHDAKVGSNKYKCADPFRVEDARYKFELNADEYNLIEFYDDAEKDDSDSDSDSDNEPADEKADKKNECGTKYSFRFAKKDVKVGYLPRLATRLISDRRSVRSKMNSLVKKLNEGEIEEDKIAATNLDIVILNKRQLGLKVIANSLYGFLGAQVYGKHPLVEGAMAITGKGRELIGEVNRYVENTYNGTIIYGDTDSSMFSIPEVKTSQDCDKMGYRLAEELSNLFPPPLRLEYEKAMNILCLKKKKYAALLIEPDGTYKGDLLIRGIVLARRDNCVLHRNLYSQLLQKILRDGAGFSECLFDILQCVNDAFEGKYPDTHFTIIKELGVKYKSPSANMRVFAEELLASGRTPKPGDRLEFVVTTTASCEPKLSRGIKSDNIGLKMRLYETWKETRSPPIDIMYYVNKALKNTIDQLYNVSFVKEIKRLGLDRAFELKANANSVPRNFLRPLDLLTHMVDELHKMRKKKAMEEIREIKKRNIQARKRGCTEVPIPDVESLVKVPTNKDIVKVSKSLGKKFHELVCKTEDVNDKRID